MKTFKEFLEESERKILAPKKRKPRTIVYAYPWNVGGYAYSMTPPDAESGTGGGSSGSGE